MGHAVVLQHADQDERVCGSVVLDDVDVGVHVKNLLHRLPQRRMFLCRPFWCGRFDAHNMRWPTACGRCALYPGYEPTSAKANLWSLLESSPALLMSVPSTSKLISVVMFAGGPDPAAACRRGSAFKAGTILRSNVV